MKELKTGMKIVLPNGEKGMFMKIRKTQCEVLRGADGEGMKACVPLAGLIYDTYSVRQKTSKR